MPGRLMAQVSPGVWEEVNPIPDEVWVGQSPPPSSYTELWANPYSGSLTTYDGNEWIPIAEDVYVGDVDPASKYPGINLWYDITSSPGILKVLVNGVWEPIGGGGGGAEEVFVGPDLDPLNPDGIELWFDTDDTSTGSGGGADEVFIGPDDPGVAAGFELWFDSDATPTAVSTGPLGRVAFAQTVTVVGGIVGSFVELVTATFTADPTRTYRTTGYMAFYSDIASDVANMGIRDEVDNVKAYMNALLPTVGQYGYSAPVAIESGLSGTQTRRLVVYRSAGSGNITAIPEAVNPGFILVEDIGGV